MRQQEGQMKSSER